MPAAGGPAVAHGTVPHHRRALLLREDESGRTMGQPADVRECFSDEAVRLDNQVMTQSSCGRVNEGKNQALRRQRLEKFIARGTHQIADEESGSLGGAWRSGGFRFTLAPELKFRMEKPIPAKTSGAFRQRLVAAEVRSSEGTNPGCGQRGRRQFGAALQRPSNG